LADVKGWAFDQNLQDMAEHLPEFDFDFWYVADRAPWPDTDQYDGIYVPFHRWPNVNKVLPYHKALGSLRSCWFDPRTPTPPTAANIALVNRYKAYHTVVQANCDELKPFCPQVSYLTNPVNMARFPKATPIRNRVIASWNGNARHAYSDDKGFRTIVQPACQVAQLPLEFAEFHTKRLAPADMPAFYLKGNLALCASKYEGASNSIMEAMAAGQGLISTAVGNVPEMRESQLKHFGDSGIVLVERDVQAFIRALQELQKDPDRVARMGQLNRAEIEARWSWSAWRDRYAEFLRAGIPKPKSETPLELQTRVKSSTFRCPDCHKPLSEKAGGVACESCGTLHPIILGIPRFTSTIDEGFDHRWQKHPKPQATTTGIFEQKTGWAPEDLKGKLVLDAGCGCGRFSRVATDFGAQVIGIDGSNFGIEASSTLVPEGTFAQGDLLRIPLADNSVDMAFSIGVLHHTSNCKASFMEVARTVKPGGSMAVWLYILPGGDGEHLSLDPEVTTAAAFLHEITKSCPPEVLHAICSKYAVKLRDLYAGKWGPLQRVLQINVSPDNDECISDTFDWHTPQYRSGHTNGEVKGWFEEAGFRVDWVGDFPVSVRGVKI
jgi:ubiquinone/menaquinone biosynthesis C-methylase UbiE